MQYSWVCSDDNPHTEYRRLWESAVYSLPSLCPPQFSPSPSVPYRCSPQNTPAAKRTVPTDNQSRSAQSEGDTVLPRRERPPTSADIPSAVKWLAREGGRERMAESDIREQGTVSGDDIVGRVGAAEGVGDECSNRGGKS